MSDNVSQVGSEDSHIRFSPSPGTYAVIRLNPVEIVRHLEDEDALAAARAMQTRSYLIWLHCELDLPFPDKPWYRFDVSPIGPHLPPANAAEGYTSDMCIPIYPNTNHPTGRAPVHPETTFPYSNCYHWIDNNIHIRVRARPEEFDETNAVQISAKTEVLMGYTFEDDFIRAMETVKLAKQAREAAPPPTLDRSRVDRPVVRGADLARSSQDRSTRGQPNVDAGHGDGRAVHLPDDPDAASVSSTWSRSSRSAPASMNSVEDIMQMDIFTGPDEDLELVPLVDLWSDLAANLQEDDIGSPLELTREIETVQSIIREARVRAYAVLNVPASNASGAGPLESSAIRSVPTRLSRLSYMSRAFYKPAKRLMLRARHVVRLPYIAVWP